MTSARLPGKVLMPLGGKPVLERLIERVRRSNNLNDVVVATTANRADDCIEALCGNIGVKCFRGSEDDVLDRVLRAARSVEADLICELMGDSPLIDPALIDRVIDEHLAGDFDYTSNCYPDNTFPVGFGVQVFPTAVLERVSTLTLDPIDRVHVSYFIYRHPDLFRLHGVRATPEFNAPGFRLTLDTREDYDLICAVFDALQISAPAFDCLDVIKLLKENPQLPRINSHVRQKAVWEG
jgi:spore coat polysaccharide biosynthesis protein SpsF